MKKDESKKILQKTLQLGNISSDFVKKFKILENLYEEGKLSLEEISVLTEINYKKLKKYFKEKAQNTNLAKNILVCGGAGFIGSNFIRFVHKKYQNYTIINYDKLTYAGNLDNLLDLKNSSRYKFIKGDICDYQKLSDTAKKYKIDYVINFAAETHVGRSVFSNVRDFVNTNVLGVTNLLELVKEYKIKRFVHISTDETYGELEINDFRSFTEDSPFRPNVPYSASKAGGDLMCRAYFQTFKTPVIVTHCTNNYGPYQYPEKVIPFWTLRALRKEPLPVHGNGSHIRDWIYVEEHCQALDMVLHKGTPGEVYNIAAKQEIPVIEIAYKILKILERPKTLIKFIQDRPGNDIRYSLDITKIKKELGFEPKVNFEEKLTEVISWYTSNKWWIQRVLKKQKEFNAFVGEL